MTWLVLIVLLFVIPEILSTVLDSRLGRAAAARLESGVERAPDQATVDRIRYLEAEVDRLSDEVSRLAEESDFLQDLLAERPQRDTPRIPPGEPKA